MPIQVIRANLSLPTESIEQIGSRLAAIDAVERAFDTTVVKDLLRVISDVNEDYNVIPAFVEGLSASLLGSEQPLGAIMLTDVDSTYQRFAGVWDACWNDEEMETFEDMALSQPGWNSGYDYYGDDLFPVLGERVDDNTFGVRAAIPCLEVSLFDRHDNPKLDKAYTDMLEGIPHREGFADKIYSIDGLTGFFNRFDG
jgi:hypothetical protein